MLFDNLLFFLFFWTEASLLLSTLFYYVFRSSDVWFWDYKVVAEVYEFAYDSIISWSDYIWNKSWFIRVVFLTFNESKLEKESFCY